MNGERTSSTERILNAIEFGRLSTDETERRLIALIENEINKTDAAADIELIDACQSLLWELHTHGTMEYDSHTIQNRECIMSRIEKLEKRRQHVIQFCKYGGAIAASFILLLGVCGKLNWAWFERSSIQDEQQFVIQGHEVSVEMISSAIAENGGNGIFEMTSIQQLDSFLGFSTGIPQELLYNLKTDACSVVILPDQINVFTVYVSEIDNSYLSYTISYFMEMDEAYISFEQSNTGTVNVILGEKVYQTQNMDKRVFSWHEGSAVHTISAQLQQEELIEIVKELLQGG